MFCGKILNGRQICQMTIICKTDGIK